MPAKPLSRATSKSLDRKPRSRQAEAATQRAGKRKHANTRTALQKTHDHAFLMKWRCRGLPLDALVEKLREELTATGRKISRAMVAFDLKEIDNIWRARREQDINTLRDGALKDLAAQEAELWEQWERSKKAGQKRTRQVTEDGVVVDGKFTGDRKTVQAVVEQDQIGDPRIMELIIRVGERRSKICGWETATKHVVTGADGAALTPAAAPIINVVIAPPPPGK